MAWINAASSDHARRINFMTYQICFGTPRAGGSVFCGVGAKTAFIKARLGVVRWSALCGGGFGFPLTLAAVLVLITRNISALCIVCTVCKYPV